jgi:t-SNARE complex subunit (syntaxin)
VRLKDFLAGVLHQNKDLSRLCASITAKYDKKSHSKGASRVRQVIREREQELIREVDRRLEGAINQIRRLKEKVKRHYV